MIFWDSERWWIRDLGSRNHTRVGGECVAPDQPTQLHPGGCIEFGTHPLSWTVESVNPPRPRALPLTGGAAIEAHDGMLALPDERTPRAVIYGDVRSGWLLELDEEVRPVADLELVTLDDKSWRLCLPQLLEPTVEASEAPLRLSHLELRFAVSRDEEHVSLSAVSDYGEIDLGSRSHHYLLLTLARARLADAELSESSRGWVYQDELSAQLQLARERLNITVFRARKQLAAAGIQGARDLIERRVDARQLRIGVAHLVIEIE